MCGDVGLWIKYKIISYNLVLMIILTSIKKLAFWWGSLPISQNSISRFFSKLQYKKGILLGCFVINYNMSILPDLVLLWISKKLKLHLYPYLKMEHLINRSVFNCLTFLYSQTLQILTWWTKLVRQDNNSQKFRALYRLNTSYMMILNILIKAQLRYFTKN